MSRPLRLLEDRDPLVAELRRRGVDYLAPSDAAGGGSIEDADLLASLASHRDPRLRQALVALFLLEPELGRLVPGLRRDLSPPASRDLLAYYLAAVYLEEMWRVLLERYLPGRGRLPDDPCRELGLPIPPVLHGEAGLHALAELHASWSNRPSNFLSEYEGVAALLLESLQLRRGGLARRFHPTSRR